MKELKGSATAPVQAPLEKCLALIESVEGYPSWYPEVVKRVDVLERAAEGTATKAQTLLHVSQGPLSKDFNLEMAVEVDRPRTVRLTRIPHHANDDERFEVLWTLEEHRISLDLNANVEVPRFLPIGGIGESVAQGFVAAAVKALDA